MSQKLIAEFILIFGWLTLVGLALLLQNTLWPKPFASLPPPQIGLMLCFFYIWLVRKLNYLALFLFSLILATQSSLSWGYFFISLTLTLWIYRWIQSHLLAPVLNLRFFVLLIGFSCYLGVLYVLIFLLHPRGSSFNWQESLISIVISFLLAPLLFHYTEVLWSKLLNSKWGEYYHE